MSLTTIRSMLFVPALQTRFVEKAKDSPADAIILDLEDAVAPNEKDNARACIRESARFLKESGCRVFVRINSSPRDVMVLDVAEAADAAIEGIVVPKVDTAEQLQEIAELVESYGKDAHLRQTLVPLIESPLGVINSYAIAKARDNVGALAFGSEDYASSINTTPEQDAMAFPAAQMALSARAAGIAALGIPGSIALVKDLDKFSSLTTLARKLGMTGILCIHPNQLALANAAFSATQQEIEDAKQIKTIYEQALKEGLGAITFRGRMIDIPHYQNALRVIGLAEGRAASKEAK